MSSEGWIGVDLDGTLAHYDGWKGVEHIGPPIPAMLERVKRWLAEGRDVRILTARVSYKDEDRDFWDRDVEGAQAAIIVWCLKHLGRALPVTCMKDYQLVELWDDRAVTVEKNTGRQIGTSWVEGAPQTVRLEAVPGTMSRFTVVEEDS